MDHGPVIANLTFGGTILVQEMDGVQKGMMCSPAGMLTSQKCMQACCCPSCLQLDFTYVTGTYDKAVSIETKAGSCLSRMQPHYIVSLKDYTKLAEDKRSQSHIEALRKRGKSDADMPQRSTLRKSLSASPAIRAHPKAAAAHAQGRTLSKAR